MSLDDYRKRLDSVKINMGKIDMFYEKLKKSNDKKQPLSTQEKLSFSGQMNHYIRLADQLSNELSMLLN